MKWALLLLAFVLIIAGCIENNEQRMQENVDNIIEDNSTEETIVTQEEICSDGTEYEFCSEEMPKYCQEGVLIDACEICSCPENMECQEDGTCQESMDRGFDFIANGTSPRIYGSKIAFESDYLYSRQKSKGLSDIFVYDITTGQSRNITDGNSYYRLAQLNDNYVVYGEYLASNDRGVYLYDIQSKEMRIIVGSDNVVADRGLYGNIVTWKWWESDYGIYTYKIAEKQITKIAKLSADMGPLSIYGNKVIWLNTTWEGGLAKKSIVMYDLDSSQEKEIITGIGLESALYYKASNNGILVIEGMTASIYDYNGKLVSRASVPSQNQYTQFSSYGNRVVWAECISQNTVNSYTFCENHDIYMLDVGSNSLTIITDDEIDQNYPDIYENKVVWAECVETINYNDCIKHSIYMHEIA